MKKTIELVSNSWGGRTVFNLWSPDEVRDSKTASWNDSKVGMLNMCRLVGSDTNIPDGTKITITIDLPRPKGWYPVIMRDKVSLREVDITEPKQRKEGILWWNGGNFVDDSPSGRRTYSEHQFSWIADEPIPDPFERVP